MSDTPTHAPPNPVKALFARLAEHVDADTLERLRLDLEYDTFGYTRLLVDLPPDAPLPDAKRLMELLMTVLSNMERTRQWDYERGVRDGKQQASIVSPRAA